MLFQVLSTLSTAGDLPRLTSATFIPGEKADNELAAFNAVAWS